MVLFGSLFFGGGFFNRCFLSRSGFFFRFFYGSGNFFSGRFSCNLFGCSLDGGFLCGSLFNCGCFLSDRSFLFLCNGAFGLSLLGSYRFRLFFFGFDFGGGAGLIGGAGIACYFGTLGSSLGALFVEPFVEFGFGVGFRERAFGNTAQKVLLIHYTLLREDCAACICGLCAFLQPI